MARKVFLIDDDSTYNSLNKRMLTKNLDEDLEIIEFTDPDKAIIEIIENKNIPDLIFLDLNMPTMDGWEFLDILTEETEDKKLNTVVAMLTSSQFPDDERRAMRYDYVKHYINKPLNVVSIGTVFK